MTDEKPPSVFDWRRTPKDSLVGEISKWAQRSERATRAVEKKRAKDPDYGKISKLTKQTL
jgi:hypothetical protein